MPPSLQPPPRPGRLVPVPLAAALAAAASLLCVLSAPGARAAWEPDGVDLTRPRLLFAPGRVAELQARLEREPYRTLFGRLWNAARDADGVPLDDQTLEAHRFKARAAKNLAFAYALDRMWEDGRAVPFPTPEAREAVGDRVRELLLNLFERSRIAIPPPLGDWDRDISTSEELLQYATAYDTLLGAGYDPGDDRARIALRLTNLASELYQNYTDPSTAPTIDLHQNNHRSKSGAALVAAGIALAEETPAPGEDPLGIREPTLWIELGLDLMDLVLRWVLTAGDGAYGEGTHYLNFYSLNLNPVMRAWDRLVDGAPWPARGGILVPSLWRHPVIRLSQRWALDMTLPDGSLVPLDDSYAGSSFRFGAAPRPADPALAAAIAWRWANAPTPFESFGNVDVAADSIVNHRDDLVPAPPPGSPSAFYLEGGTAIFRSDWSADAVMAVVVGEHDTASEFGRDRDGLGVYPQSHEHEEPGSFVLHAFGERLLLDPGMVRFALENPLAAPPAHSVVLIDGEGPVDYTTASLLWRLAPEGRPPADGHATLHAELDGSFLDAVSVVTRYGEPAPDPAQVRRRFLFPDDRYLVVADRIDGGGAPREITALFHGNGGGTSGGDFETTDTGARWSRDRARLDAAVAFADSVPDLATSLDEHEAPPGRQRLTHETLRAGTAGERVHGLHLLYPSPAGQAGPTLRRLARPGTAGLALEDVDGDRRVAVLHRAEPGPPLVLGADETGLGEVESDGSLLLVDGRRDGRLRLLWAEEATRLVHDGALQLETATPGRLGLGFGDGRLDLVAENADAVLELPALDFAPVAADGACALHRLGERVFVALGRERRVGLRAGGGPSRPAADPGPDRRVAVGETVVLDAAASCSAEGDPLTPHWELVSAPPGSDWRFRGDDSMRASLDADRAGTYRVRLVVSDPTGLESRPVEVRIDAGPACSDGRDGDLDGWIDSDDPDCDTLPGNAAPKSVADAVAVPAGPRFESAASVLANDADPDGEPFGAVLEEAPAHGALVLLADGRFVYEPEPGFAGVDSFRYRARDARGAESEAAAVTLDVAPAAPADEAGFWLLRGPGSWFTEGRVLEGNLAIERGRLGRFRRIRGGGRLDDPESPNTTFSLDIRRVFAGFLWGEVTVSGPALPDGGLAPEPAIGWLGRVEEDRVSGILLGLSSRPPFLLFWSLRDAAPPDGG